MTVVLLSIILLGAIGAMSAIILYLASRKFQVEEDSRIVQIQEVLPSANCGGCGFAGCNNFATAVVKINTLDGLNCPVGGDAVMQKIAVIMGQTVEKSVPRIAVVHCNGSCENRQKTTIYDGIKQCSAAFNLYGGDTACPFGCLGSGDCVTACPFDAIHIDPETLLPVVDEDKCTACGKCVSVCPKSLIQLRKKGPLSRRIYVSCVNRDKPAVAMKSCRVACIACKKCQKICSFEAITIENNVAYIDDNKCRLCRKCVSECPTGAIKEINFPIKTYVENI